MESKGFLWAVAFASALGFACSEDDGDDPPDSPFIPSDRDGGRPIDDGPIDWDCDLAGAGGMLVSGSGPMVEVSGVIRAGALPVPLPGEPELGAMRGPDSQIAGAEVTLRGADGTVISRDTTDCDGQYVLPAPPNTQVFIAVAPIDGPGGGYPGYVESRRVESGGLEQWDMTLLRTFELDWRLDMLGREYDRSTGWIVQSFASTRTPGGGLEGGEGLEVSGTATGPSFAVTGSRTIETNVLPPECDDGTGGVERGEPVLAADGSIVCYTDLLEMIFVSGVGPTSGARLRLVDPPGKTCTQREDVPRWIVLANTVSRVRADCR